MACLDRRPLGVLLAGILAALLAPFQFFAFPATYLIVGAVRRRRPAAWRARTVLRDAVLFLAPVVLAAAVHRRRGRRQGDIGAFRFVSGWGEARFGDGPAAVAFFYLTNLGIPFVLAVIAAFTARGTCRARWFLVAWLVALFLVPNVVVVSAVEFDMNKYFQIMWIAVAILAAWLIRALADAGRSRRSCVVSALSPALIAIWHVRSTVVALGPPQEAAARLDRGEHAGARRSSSPTPSSTARSISPGGCGSRRSGRTSRTSATTRGRAQTDIKAIYCDGPRGRGRRGWPAYGATYVLSSGGEPVSGEAGRPTSARARSSRPSTTTDGVTVWRLAGS